MENILHWVVLIGQNVTFRKSMRNPIWIGCVCAWQTNDDWIVGIEFEFSQEDATKIMKAMWTNIGYWKQWIRMMITRTYNSSYKALWKLLFICPYTAILNADLDANRYQTEYLETRIAGWWSLASVLIRCLMIN